MKNISKKIKTIPIGKIGLAGLAGIFFLLAGIFPNWTSASSPVSVSVAPLSFDLAVNPGEEKDGKMVVRNNSDQETRISVEFSDFFMDDDGKYIFSSGKDQPDLEKYKNFSMANWLETDKENFVLAKGQSQEIKFSLKVPAGAVLGGHYGAVFFRTSCELQGDKNVIASDKSSVCVSARPGILFLVQVGGSASKKGILKKVEAPRLSLSGKANFSVEIENAGNTHFRPEGQIVSKNLFGQEIAKMEIKDKTILPTMSRKFSEDLTRKDLLGFYKIQGSIRDGDGNEMKLTRYIFMPAWKEILSAVLIVAAFFWFLKKFRISARGGSQPKADQSMTGANKSG